MPNKQNATRIKSNVKLEVPSKYKVIMHNDDFTTMDFVVIVLQDVFMKSEDEAERLMLEVHHKGQAVVGIYSFDVATTKVERAMEMAKQQGFPFRLTVEQA